MPFGLDDKTIAAIKKVFTRYPQIEKVILFGSRAKGTFKKGSDIDFTLLGDNLDLEIVGKIQSDLDDLLLPYTFDISIFKQINNQNLIDHVQRIGISFYSCCQALNR